MSKTSGLHGNFFILVCVQGLSGALSLIISCKILSDVMAESAKEWSLFLIVVLVAGFTEGYMP